jgi:hypothetical protein
VAETNIKAGLGINKIGRWEKYRGEITGRRISRMAYKEPFMEPGQNASQYSLFRSKLWG